MNGSGHSQTKLREMVLYCLAWLPDSDMAASISNLTSPAMASLDFTSSGDVVECRTKGRKGRGAIRRVEIRAMVSRSSSRLRQLPCLHYLACYLLARLLDPLNEASRLLEHRGISTFVFIWLGVIAWSVSCAPADHLPGLTAGQLRFGRVLHLLGCG